MNLSNLWQTVRIKEVCDITSSKRIYASDYQTTGIPFYRGKEIIEKQKGALDILTELYISKGKYNSIKSKFGVPQSGDLLLTSVGTLGIPYIIKQKDHFYFKDGNLTWFKEFRNLDSKYLYYWLLSGQGKAQLKKCMIRSSQPAFTIVLLKDMEIGLPPLPTQRKIASILSFYDDLIENNNRRIKILGEMAKLIYQEWFVNYRFPGYENIKMLDSPLGTIPDDWSIKSLNEMCTTIIRGVTPKYEPGSQCYIINQKTNQGESLKLTELKELERNLTVPDEKYARCEDLLVNSLGEGTIGRVHLFMGPHKKWAVDQHMTICRSTKRGVTPYLYMVLNSPEGQNKLNAVKTGATNMTMLNISTLRDMKFIFPSVELLTGFYSIVGKIFEYKYQLEKTNLCLSYTRDLLLPKLISGEINVSDLNIDIGDDAT